MSTPLTRIRVEMTLRCRQLPRHVAYEDDARYIRWIKGYSWRLGFGRDFIWLGVYVAIVCFTSLSYSCLPFFKASNFPKRMKKKNDVRR